MLRFMHEWLEDCVEFIKQEIRDYLDAAAEDFFNYKH